MPQRVAVAEKVCKNVRAGKVCAASPAALLREAKRQAHAQTADVAVEKTDEVVVFALRAVAELDVVPPHVREVLRAMLETGTVKDFTDQYVEPCEAFCLARLCGLCRRRRC